VAPSAPSRSRLANNGLEPRVNLQLRSTLPLVSFPVFVSCSCRMDGDFPLYKRRALSGHDGILFLTTRLPHLEVLELGCRVSDAAIVPLVQGCVHLRVDGRRYASTAAPHTTRPDM
jgi:hypothetical protein